MRVKLLITGIRRAKSVVHSARWREAGNIDYQAYSSAELDITRESKVLRVMRRNRPTSGYRAAIPRHREELTTARNRDTRYLAKACSRYGAPSMSPFHQLHVTATPAYTPTNLIAANS